MSGADREIAGPSGPGWSILGMPVLTREDGSDEKIVQPLAALVVVKALDHDGAVGYLVRATEGLSAVEAHGMAGYAADRLRASFSHNQPGGLS